MQILREFNFVSVLARLLPALLTGGIIGFGRARKKQAADVSPIGAAVVPIGPEINEDKLFAGLIAAMDEIRAFEANLKRTMTVG